MSIDTPVGQIKCRGTGEAGEEVCLSVRPEAIHCGKPNGRDRVDLGSSVLSDFVFQGTFRRCTAMAGANASVELQLRVPLDTKVDAETPTPIWTRSSDIVVLREGAE